MWLADGSRITGRLVTIGSVRVGKFTAENVQCAVLGAEAANAPSLLGMSFLENFKFQVDAAKGTLKMVQIRTEAKRPQRLCARRVRSPQLHAYVAARAIHDAVAHHTRRAATRAASGSSACSRSRGAGRSGRKDRTARSPTGP